MRVLYLYAAGEFPIRKTAWSYIYSFQRYSEHEIFYHNVAISPLPVWAHWVTFDLVIFSQYMTSPWNPDRFKMRMKAYEDFDFGEARKIAFFQDEFFNTDLRVQFLNRLNIDAVYTVAPESEIPKIYTGVTKRIRFVRCLTGYVDENELPEESETRRERSIDVGYRTGWSNKGMFRLGTFGTLKYKIGERFLNSPGDLRVDIKIGREFLNGKAWFKFLGNCRYTLGVESGFSLLDRDGEIQSKIQATLSENPDLTFEEVSERCFPGLDGNLDVKAISPRIFEAAAMRTGLVLVEGDYQGILAPNLHYIPLKADFSNFDEVVERIANEPNRREMVDRTYNDLIKSGTFTYRRFVQNFFEAEGGILPLRPVTLSPVYVVARVNDLASWTALGLLTAMRKLASATRSVFAHLMDSNFINFWKFKGGTNG